MQIRVLRQIKNTPWYAFALWGSKTEFRDTYWTKQLPFYTALA